MFRTKMVYCFVLLDVSLKKIEEEQFFYVEDCLRLVCPMRDSRLCMVGNHVTIAKTLFLSGSPYREEHL